MAGTIDSTQYNFTINQNATKAVPFQLIDSQTGAPIDLTNMTVKADAKVAYTDVSASFSFTVPIIAPTSGSATLSLAASQSAAIPAGNYVYDVLLSDLGTGQKWRLMEGTITVDPGVTH